MLATLGAVGSLVLAKGKYVLVALKLTKLTPLISMIGTSLAYSYIFGWQYGVGMVALIFVHETGHALAMLHYKIPFSPMVFIPFLGASISMKELPANSVQDSMIAIAGPVAGSLAAFCCMIMGDYSGGQIWYALADFGFMINLFNLMPIGQMDGGRIGNAIHPSFGVAGVVLGASLLWNGYIHNPIVILFILSGAYSSLSRYMGWSTVPESFYRISSITQIQLALMYFAVVIVLCLCMLENNKRRKTPKQLQAGRHQSYGGLESLMNADDDDARWR